MTWIWKYLIFDIVSNNVVVGGLNVGFTDPVTAASWFIPLEPQFPIARAGLGLHPDGNVPGTQGCVGITGADANRFCQRWNATPFTDRPILLEVVQAAPAASVP